MEQEIKGQEKPKHSVNLLTLFEKLVSLEKEFPNDTEFGREVRRTLSLINKK